MVMGLVVDYWKLIFLAWWSGVFAGVLRKMGCRTWFFAGEIVVDCW
jgi:hypothetical protein